MEWISVNDRLPDEGEKVLTINLQAKGYHEYRLDYLVDLDNGERIWACRLNNEYDKVTHWMPLPDSPKFQSEVCEPVRFLFPPQEGDAQFVYRKPSEKDCT